MMSIFWYYRPEHTKQGIQESYAEDEVFASKHKDHNSVATVEDKCYVLTYAEYCRFDKISNVQNDKQIYMIRFLGIVSR